MKIDIKKINIFESTKSQSPNLFLTRSGITNKFKIPKTKTGLEFLIWVIEIYLRFVFCYL